MSALPIPLTNSILTNSSAARTSKTYCFGLKTLPPKSCRSPPKASFLKNDCNTRCSPERWPLFLTRRGIREENLVVARAQHGVGFSGGGGGGGSEDGNSSTRVLGNLALAIGLTYLTMTGQLGWILDAVVSIWLIAVLLPIMGLGAFFWFAGRDIVQDSCPNCGNNFQIFKSALEDGPQLCPFCTQPFSVQGNKFVRESAKFSSDRTTKYGQVFNGFSPGSMKGKASPAAVVDIEAEVRDID